MKKYPLFSSGSNERHLSLTSTCNSAYVLQKANVIVEHYVIRDKLVRKHDIVLLMVLQELLIISLLNFYSSSIILWTKTVQVASLNVKVNMDKEAIYYL